MRNKKDESEIVFLDGPQSRWNELKFTFQTMFELIRGFRALHFIGPCITVFGSARFKEDHPYYELTRKAAAAFARLGFTILTGGGPGLMEAANRGAKDVNGRSVGCNIQLPVEQKPNPYLDKWIYMRHFFIRKVLLVKYSFAFIVMPGGYGTMDEYFEALTLIQTHTIKDFPIIIFGKEYHKELLAHIEEMNKNATITNEDAHLFMVTDSIDEAVNLIVEKSIKQFNLHPKRRIKPFKWLFERE
ncbi:MAG: LOG family protein [Mucilaginibacter sp.]